MTMFARGGLVIINHSQFDSYLFCYHLTSYCVVLFIAHYQHCSLYWIEHQKSDQIGNPSICNWIKDTRNQITERDATKWKCNQIEDSIEEIEEHNFVEHILGSYRYILKENWDQQVAMKSMCIVPTIEKEWSQLKCTKERKVSQKSRTSKGKHLAKSWSQSSLEKED